MSVLTKRPRVIVDDDDEDDLLNLANALDQDVFDDERPAKIQLSAGVVSRLMRNLIVNEPPIVVCLSVEGNYFRLWDGQRAVDALSAMPFAPGGVYRLDKYSNDRREGKRELRIFAASLQGELEKRFFPISVVMHDQVVLEEEKPPALCTAMELANATGETLRVALHALYVMNGSPSAAFEYLTNANVQGWTPQEDSAFLLDDLLERRLHDSLSNRNADEQDLRASFLKG